ncbi:MAG: helix-turn-helix transcriptional regulator [Actinomycetota bacterium]|nr:helix-turn-helix transcriptional regulator [Actinomycetota bacterium]
MAETFKDKLNFLFATKLSPDGDKYSLREVSKGTGSKISPAYLQNLRKGTYKNPTYEKIKALADFFGVLPCYFYNEEAARKYYEQDCEELKKMLADPQIKEIALRATEIDDQTKTMVLQLIKKAKELSEKK